MEHHSSALAKLAITLCTMLACAAIAMHTSWSFEMHTGAGNLGPEIYSVRPQVLHNANLYFEKDLPRLKRPMHQDHIKVFVVGPESSGTRYLSRGIAQLIDSNMTWDGEFPVCKRLRERNVDRPRTYDIVHISLPLGGRSCDELDVVRVSQDFDICELEMAFLYIWARGKEICCSAASKVARTFHRSNTLLVPF